ncbi:MAG TPA: hypothetical protein VFY14_16725 [Streptomyces sp.]|nr:hypothetical protein [Streptomyces sp.]
MKPEDVPEEAVAAFCRTFWGASTVETHPAMIELARTTLAAVLPVHERQVMTRLFGMREEVAAREAEAAQRAPDDTVRLCEMARPGEHERRVRERVTAEIEAAADELERQCAKSGAAYFRRAARRARGEAQ